ncbi:MAG TPA: hypothetical protein DIW51_13550 [Rhodospirillaceae bacterium]|nr:hypothetical protein [Magnetovibrio sp.]HBT41604.1 hypothetical protein [Rhodospirillaceae bacterium]HCS70983.1 hypothetical protein [Rhodospirillaceae bacterium]
MDQDKTRKPAIKQTELQRLQNEMVGGAAADKAKKAPSAAKARMMKGARNACGPLNGRDWRWGGN